MTIKVKAILVALAFSGANYYATEFAHANDNNKNTQTNLSDRSLYIFNRQDTNKDGFVSKLEMINDAQARFTNFDANKDGQVSKTELTDFYNRPKNNCKCSQ